MVDYKNVKLFYDEASKELAEIEERATSIKDSIDGIFLILHQLYSVDEDEQEDVLGTIKGARQLTDSTYENLKLIEEYLSGLEEKYIPDEFFE